MANVPQDLKYSKDHEWVRSLDKERVRIGITDFAQKQLGDIVYVELPKVDDTFDFSEPIGSIESVKAVSEVYTPVSGKIAAVNETLNDSPEETNTEPYGEGWLVELTLSNPKELDELLSAAEYEQYVKEETS